VKRTIWRPLVLGIVLGILAGASMATELSINTTDPAGNTHTIGFYMSLFLLAAALGGPLAAVIAPAITVSMAALYGPPELQELGTIPEVFWSNILGLGATLLLTGLIYRVLFRRLKMPVRLLPWAAIVVVHYLISMPATITPQYLLQDGVLPEIPAAVWQAYRTYWPQMIFDIFFTSLVFVALPASLTRPLWYEPGTSAKPGGRTDRGRDQFEAA
jgi:hypothetical protein